MFKILSFFSVQNIFNNLKNIFFRFSLSFILAILVVSLFLVLINWNLESNLEENIVKIILSSIISFFLSVWIYLNTEILNISKIKQNLFQIITIWFWVLFYFWINFEYYEWIIFFILTYIWIIAYIFFAPFTKELYKNNISKDIYFSYIYKIWITILLSILLWIVVTLLWFLWFFWVKELFNLDFIDDEIFWSWFAISASLIAPLYVLSNIPKKEEIQIIITNKFYNFLIKYISIPFIYLYFIILYTYSIKVIINFSSWPNWIISWLIIIFSIFWYLIFIYSSNLEDENKTIKFFRKFFPYVVLPQIYMLFYAVYLRIEQYSITINRYFVIVFWIWLTVISLYYIVSKIKSLSFIFAILTIFTIIISVWPWWVYNLPEKLQYNLLIKNLEEGKIIQNWKIIPLQKEENISENLSKNIYSKIDYICRYHSCDILTSWVFKNEYNELLKINKNPKYYDIISYLTDYIKVKNYYNSIYEEKNTISIYIDSIYPLEIEWYKEIISLDSFSPDNQNEKTAFLDIQTNRIKIYENYKIIKEINIKEIINKLKTYKSWEINKKDLIFEVDWYKIIFTNIFLQKDDKIDINEVWSINWFLMIK